MVQVVAAVLLLVWPAPANSLIPHQQSACPKVMFIGARGSGEAAKASTQGMGPSVDYLARQFHQQLAQDHESMGVLPVIYSADSVNDLKPSKVELAGLIAGGPVYAAAYYYEHNVKRYLHSISEGVSQAVTEVDTTVNACPVTEIVLAGYSQGAIVIHQAELELQRKHDVDGLAAIAGVLLVADGDRVPSSAAKAFGTASTLGDGVQVALHGVKKRDVLVPEVTAEVCQARDIVCDFSFKQVLEGHAGRDAGVHEGYLTRHKALLNSAVRWLAANRYQLCYPNPGRVAHDVYARDISCAGAGRTIDGGHFSTDDYLIPGYHCRTVANVFESTLYRCQRGNTILRFSIGG